MVCDHGRSDVNDPDISLMSIPTLTGLNLLSRADASTNLSAYGQNSNKWVIDTEIFKEGSGAFMTKFNQTGEGGGGYDAVGGIDGTNNLFIGWLNVVALKQITDQANKGAYVRLTSANSWTTNYYDYVIGGEGTSWVGRGYRLVALDPNRTPDVDQTLTTTNIQRFGFGFTADLTAAQTPSFGHDVLWYGKAVAVTGPSLIDGTNGITLNDNGGSADTIARLDGGSFVTDGWETGDYVKVTGSATTANNKNYLITNVTASTLTLSTGDLSATDTANTSIKILCSVTLEDIYNRDLDEVGNTDNNRGVIDKDPAGAYVINYPLVIGDRDGSGDCYFRSTGDVVVLADQPLSETRVNYIETAEGTGNTYFEIGGAGATGSSIIGETSIFSTPTPRGNLFDSDISGLTISGTTFSQLDGGINFLATSATDHSITNSTFGGCGKIDVGYATFNNNTILNAVDSDAILLSQPSNTISNCSFTSGGTGHAIRITTAGSYNFVGHNYQDYAAVDGNTGNEVLINTSGSPVTINVSGGDTPTVDSSTGSGLVTIVSSSTITLTGMKDNTEVRVFEAGTTTPAGSPSGIENATAGTTDDRSFSFTISNSPPNIDIRVFNIDFEPADILDFEVTGTVDLPIDQKTDRVYENPP